MRDKASKTKGFFWLATAVLLGTLFATGLSPLAHLVPWSLEKKLGAVLQEDLPKGGCGLDPTAETLLQGLVKRLYPIESDDKDFPISVRVAPSTVVNAYAGLGGVITLDSGLLHQAGSPEELAGVLAHEIEHVHHRHIMEGAITHFFTMEGIQLILGQGSSAGFARELLDMDFTREQERQADEGGLERLQMAHVDNQGFKRFFERMEKEHGSTFLSDHPSNKERIGMVGKFKNRDVQPLMTKKEWEILRNYCGGR